MHSLKRFSAILCLLVATAFTAVAQEAQYAFEKEVPSQVRARGRGTVALTPDRYKDGASSLVFSWAGQAELMVVDPERISASMADMKNGVMIWVCNDTPDSHPARISFRNAAGVELCWTELHMDFRGWRAVWVKWLDMRSGNDGKYVGDLPPENRPKDGAVMAIRPSAMTPAGSFCIDRLSFSTTAINAQVTPDAQIPDNNHFLARRNMWHWCRLWEWEQNPRFEDMAVDKEQSGQLALIKKHLDQFYHDDMPSGGNYDAVGYRNKLDAQYAKMGLRRLSDGTVVGAPIVSNDESAKGDVKIQEAFEVLYREALDYHFTKSATALERFYMTGDHLLYQGLAWGSGMGTNHHYGYSIRGWSNAMWIMQDELRESGRMSDWLSALEYWSGLAECRVPLENGRDEIIDSWNTLLLPKLTAALLQPTEGLQFRAMTSLADWMSKTMTYTPGTIGGFKVDGTAFHHGGHYPAYATGAFSTLGTYLRITLDTCFEPSDEGKACLKKCLMAMRDYCNLYDWGFGIGGRHPFGGRIPNKTCDTFGFLALMGDQTGSGMECDPELGGAFLSLGGHNEDVNARLRKAGVKATSPAEGFSVYNYGAFGIMRRKGWMVCLKGFNSDVWGSEIYTNDNRFGRYQSYGSVEVINTGNPASAEASRLSEEGWDWNRLPGTTTIHLPWDKLNSPNKGTLMERNSSHFPGVSSLEGRNGVLAFTYVEADRKNFCAGATATKSVFCFDDRFVFIGTGIANSSSYPTETTLFQERMDDRTESLLLDDGVFQGFPKTWKQNGGDAVTVEDLCGNCWFVKAGQNLVVETAEQTSPDNTNKKMGRGDFVSAWLDHGISPEGASYEYMMAVEPTAAEIRKYSKKLPYKVLQADNDAHVVMDLETGITAYVSYNGYTSTATGVTEIPAETIVMERTREDGSVVVSVCTPDLGITQKDYTTPQPSQPLHRTIRIYGQTLEADCVDGQPVEFAINR